MCLRSTFHLICSAPLYSALFSQPEFISSAEIRALWISAHQIQLMYGMNPGARPRNDCLKKKHNIFLNDQSPFRSGLLSISNITSAISLSSPCRVFKCSHGQTRLPAREQLGLGYASFFNIILKWNWLHLNRHGDKSQQHLAGAGFIANGTITVPAEHHPLTCDWVQHYCTMMELLHRERGQTEKVSYGRAKGWRCSQAFLFILSGAERWWVHSGRLRHEVV